MKRYQDLVIKNGQLIGKWEELYSSFEDPWNQSLEENVNDSRRLLVDVVCRRISRDLGRQLQVMEVGCGLGHMTDRLRSEGFSAIGVDCSATAIERASALYPESTFKTASTSDPKFFLGIDVDVLVMAEVTWYILDHFEKFLKQVVDISRTRKRPVWVVHLLVTYAPGVQQYGNEVFSDLVGIEGFFENAGLRIIESAEFFTSRNDGANTFLLAKAG